MGKKKISRKGLEVMEFEKLQEIIAEVLNVEYEQAFVFPNGEKIQIDKIGSEPIKLNMDEM